MLLEVKDLNAWYRDLRVLNGVNFRLGEKELVSVVGGNGAGKTSLLKALAGLVPTKNGTVRFQGKDISHLAIHQLVELGIVLVPEGRDIFPQMNVLENIELGACSRRASKRRDANMKKVFGLMPALKDRKRQAAGTLSGGEQQMVAIARGLMSDPIVLLLDEPSLGLSPMLVQNLLKLIASLHREEHIGIVLVEQNVKHALSISDRAYVMENGRIAFEGNSKEILNDEKTKRAYLGR
jgi:branched-chain amino acid transport system ATP-binding protein